MSNNLEGEAKKPVKQIKEAGFCNLCCSYCCLLTGFTGIILLGLFSLCLYQGWYFEAELQLPEKNQEEYTTKALIFLVGMIIEAAIFVASIFWVMFVNKRNKAAKQVKNQ